MLLTGISLFYWFMDSTIDALLLQKNRLVESLFMPDWTEILLRILVIALFFIIGSMFHNRLTYYDSLTDLPNRILLRDRLQHAIQVGERGNYTVGLILMDLDRFKEINDTLSGLCPTDLVDYPRIPLKFSNLGNIRR